MPTDQRSAEFELLARLRRSPTLRALACNAVRGLTGTISLSVAGRSLGSWWFELGTYRFAKVAYLPHILETTSAEEAVKLSTTLATRAISSIDLPRIN